jgi:hypothetical protein
MVMLVLKGGGSRGRGRNEKRMTKEGAETFFLAEAKLTARIPGDMINS